jgi:hypothetical protein
LEPEIQHIEQRLCDLIRRPPKNRLKIVKRVFEKYDITEITDSVLQDTSQLFSENYGIWGVKTASVMDTFAKEDKLAHELLIIR